MKAFVPFFAICVAIVPAQAAETYRIDPVHSSVGFKIKHLYSKVTGRFSDVQGTITGDPDKPEEARVNVEIKTASIDTGDQKRDTHLRSGEFFGAEEFPTMTFASKKVNRTGEDTAFVTGDLTMHGVTKESILQVKFQGKGKDATGAIRTGWEARTALKRSDFGLAWSKAVEGTQVVSDDVEIELNIEGVEDKGESLQQTTAAPAPSPVPATAAAVPPVTTEPAPVAPTQAPLPLVFQTPEQRAAVSAPAATPAAAPIAPSADAAAVISTQPTPVAPASPAAPAASAAPAPGAPAAEAPKPASDVPPVKEAGAAAAADAAAEQKK